MCNFEREVATVAFENADVTNGEKCESEEKWR
jgi:hypothetical protein